MCQKPVAGLDFSNILAYNPSHAVLFAIAVLPCPATLPAFSVPTPSVASPI